MMSSVLSTVSSQMQEWPRTSPHPGQLGPDREHVPPQTDTPALEGSSIQQQSNGPPAPKRMRPTFRREFTDTINTYTLDRCKEIEIVTAAHALLDTKSRSSTDSEMTDKGLVAIIEEEHPPTTSLWATGITAHITWRTAALLLAFTAILQTLFLVSSVMIPVLPRRPPTDFPGLPPRRPSSMRYTYALQPLSNGTLHPSTPSPFVGPPSPAIDAAWETLVGSRYFRLSDVEISKLGKPLEPLPLWTGAVDTPGYYAGIDMLHSLHCVNSLRLALEDPNSHSEEMLLLPGEERRLHLDHCIEQLRQAILCHADATPVTLKPVISVFTDTKGMKRRVLTMLGETEREHSCPDNGMELIAWVQRMAKERGSV